MKAKGEVFRKLRESQKITQKQIANFLSVDQSLISKFETNERQLGIELLEKCSDLFGCSVRVFFEDIETETLFGTAFRTTATGEIELDVIAKLNRIALNLMMMEEMEQNETR